MSKEEWEAEFPVMAALRREQQDHRQAIIDYALETKQTLQAIGQHFDITRERVRQIIADAGLDNHFQALRKQDRRDLKREELYAEFAERAANATECIICGCWILRKAIGSAAVSAQLTCSIGCAKKYVIIRRYLNDDEFRIHRKSVVERIIRTNGEGMTSPGAAVRYAKRVLAGQQPRVRYILDGSEADLIMKELDIPFPRASEVFKDGLPWLAGRPPATHCRRGHSLSGDNIRVTKDGHRQCKACERERRQEQRHVAL